jgi:hypothetical protein
MLQGKCVKCQSEKLIPQARIIDKMGHGIRLGVKVYENPEALLFKGTHFGELLARICGDCGHVEIYVENPQDLYSTYSDSGKES